MLKSNPRCFCGYSNLQQGDRPYLQWPRCHHLQSLGNIPNCTGAHSNLTSIRFLTSKPVKYFPLVQVILSSLAAVKDHFTQMPCISSISSFYTLHFTLYTLHTCHAPLLSVHACINNVIHLLTCSSNKQSVKQTR